MSEIHSRDRWRHFEATHKLLNDTNLMRDQTMKEVQKRDHVSINTLVNYLRDRRFVIPDFQRKFSGSRGTSASCERQFPLARSRSYQSMKSDGRTTN
jgi:hypothetical protein